MVMSVGLEISYEILQKRRKHIGIINVEKLTSYRVQKENSSHIKKVCTVGIDFNTKAGKWKYA